MGLSTKAISRRMTSFASTLWYYEDPNHPLASFRCPRIVLIPVDHPFGRPADYAFPLHFVPALSLRIVDYFGCMRISTRRSEPQTVTDTYQRHPCTCRRNCATAPHRLRASQGLRRRHSLVLGDHTICSVATINLGQLELIFRT